MPLPAWMKGHPGAPRTGTYNTPAEPTATPDMWEGKALPVRNVTHTNLNYRLYDGRTGTLLSFNSTNSLNSVVADVLRTRDENPTARIVAVEYDGPAWPDAPDDGLGEPISEADLR